MYINRPVRTSSAPAPHDLAHWISVSNRSPTYIYSRNWLVWQTHAAEEKQQLGNNTYAYNMLVLCVNHVHAPSMVFCGEQTAKGGKEGRKEGRSKERLCCMVCDILISYEPVGSCSFHMHWCSIHKHARTNGTRVSEAVCCLTVCQWMAWVVVSYNRRWPHYDVPLLM